MPVEPGGALMEPFTLYSLKVIRMDEIVTVDSTSSLTHEFTFT